MIRVIYRWRVDRQRHDEFARWWHEGTVRIRASRSGARGSTLVKPTGSHDYLVAIARWDSEDDLAVFWGDPAGPGFPGADLESVEVLVELDHLTVEAP
ncbi:MAG TPA: antibiotic biosynthesis monooxygenase [Acidimicrobiales bacterium]|nr:antibiotic biosynthesis monooxygenase [Acidimicrobiales bacterium]